MSFFFYEQNLLVFVKIIVKKAIILFFLAVFSINYVGTFNSVQWHCQGPSQIQTKPTLINHTHKKNIIDFARYYLSLFKSFVFFYYYCMSERVIMNACSFPLFGLEYTQRNQLYKKRISLINRRHRNAFVWWVLITATCCS